MAIRRALRRFPRRGLPRARTHIGLLVLVHNLLAYQRSVTNKNTPNQEALKCVVATT